MTQKNHYSCFLDIMEQWSHRGFAVGMCFINGTPNQSKFTYAPEFLKVYEEEGLAAHDLTLRLGFIRDGCWLWSEMEPPGQASKAFITAQRFGMGDGVCFAETVNGMKSIASISIKNREEARRVPRDEIIEKMQLAALEVSRSAVAQISKNTREFLQLFGEGKRDAEIAQALNITEAGVRQRKKNVLAEFNAQTPAQALAIAAASGAIKVRI